MTNSSLSRVGPHLTGHATMLRQRWVAYRDRVMFREEARWIRAQRRRATRLAQQRLT